MGTKQVQMKFQVAANDGVSAQVTITVDGIQKFSGALGQTANPLPGQVLSDATPFSLAEFDLDVEDLTKPVTNDDPQSWIISKDVIISVTGGSVCLQSTETNYTSKDWANVDPPDNPQTQYIVPGSASTFGELDFATQPVWTPPAVGRLDIASGTGSLLLLDNESVAYQVAMTLYSA